MAVTSPKTVVILTLIEPPVPFLISPDALNFFLGVIGQAMASMAQGIKKGHLIRGWEEVVEQTVPGGYAQALADVDAAILVDASSAQTWNLQPEYLRAITQPVLYAFHVDPVWKGFEDVHQGLAALLPHIETLVVPNATHLMQIQNPRSVAEGLASFLARHPISIHA